MCMNGVWKQTAAIKTYYFCDVEDERGNSWVGGIYAYKRGGFCESPGCYYAEDTNIFRDNEICFVRFGYPPLEGYSSKRCYICNGSEDEKYELINAAAIGSDTYKIQFTGSVFKVISYIMTG